MNLALKKYTNFETDEFEGVEQSITIVKDQLEVLGQMFHNFNSKDFFEGSPVEQLACLNRAVEYVQLTEELERRFMAAVKRMKQAFKCGKKSSLDAILHRLRLQKIKQSNQAKINMKKPCGGDPARLFCFCFIFLLK